MLLESYGPTGRDMRLGEKLLEINWGFVLIVCLIAGIGFVLLYSVAGGSFEPWATRQMSRFAVGFAIMLAVATIDIRVWMSLAYPSYAVALFLLVLVEFFGQIGMGAQRWINLGFFQLQPSELM